MLSMSGHVARCTALPSLRRASGLQRSVGCGPASESVRAYHRVKRLPVQSSRVAYRPLPRSSGVQRAQSTAAGSGTTKYSFDELRALLAPALAGGPDPRPSPPLILDVRNPDELQDTGRIPTALNMPVGTVPDGAFLPPDEFEDRFGFPKPTAGDEVVFYCRSGVRSRAAAQMVADLWGCEGIKVSEFPGSWTEWESRGGEVER